MGAAFGQPFVFSQNGGNLRRSTLFFYGSLELQNEHESCDFKHFEPNIKSSKSPKSEENRLNPIFSVFFLEIP
jgi:hypothetical protein